MFCHFWYFMFCKFNKNSQLTKKYRKGDPYEYDDLPTNELI